MVETGLKLLKIENVDAPKLLVAIDAKKKMVSKAKTLASQLLKNRL